MKIRFLILVGMFLPIFFLFGLDSYLGRYEYHSKYLSQMKDRMLDSVEMSGNKITNFPLIIDSIDKGNYSMAAYCLRFEMAAGERCRFDKSGIKFESISNIDIRNGANIDRSSERIDDFKEKVMLEGSVYNNGFDYDYDTIADNDISSWMEYNNTTRKRFGYFSDTKITDTGEKVEYFNWGSAFKPGISSSSVTPIEGGRIRILAISDSYGAGDGLISSEDTWARELESQLNSIEDRYEVIILAQSGAGYNEFLNWVKQGYIEAIDPDIVLLSYYRNDFNLLHDLGSDGNDFKNISIDTEFVFYLRCFEEDDDFFGRGLKRFIKFLPNIYRFYKFSSCGEEIALNDGNALINHVDVVESYKEIDSLINVPLYLYQLESTLQSDEMHNNTLNTIRENGLSFIVNKEDRSVIHNENCLDIYSSNFKNCEIFKANKFDSHFNRFYYKKHIENNIVEIKNRIDTSISNRETRGSEFRSNKSQLVIVDHMPISLFVSNKSSGSASVGLIKGELYGYGLSSQNFCFPFNRKGVVINFNRYLTEGREIRVSSKFQREGLALISRGYDSEGREIFGKAEELSAASSVSFVGSESVRGLIVLGNNKDCSSKEIDINEEFLLEVEVL
jgi:hypothetical protein